MKVMTILSAATALMAFTAPASAFYTQCTVAQDADLANRPGGSTDPRFMPVTKGDKVAFRDRHEGWWFVMHSSDGTTDYGWLPENILTKCKKMDGTP
ncbi:hypothetical protein ACQPTN_00655 [Bradyrhizobium sp. 13971]|uniref:hypothetical protein n=1 Tax=Bradyrhizobium elkanii TaxID=29448 RepID=UPI0008419F39|nr:hypothetical protein [Bradyrhizobium elkanii]